VGDDVGRLEGALDGIGVGVPDLNVGYMVGIKLGAFDGDDVG